jgi:hypothetical protein
MSIQLLLASLCTDCEAEFISVDIGVQTYQKRVSLIPILVLLLPYPMIYSCSRYTTIDHEPQVDILQSNDRCIERARTSQNYTCVILHLLGARLQSDV